MYFKVLDQNNSEIRLIRRRPETQRLAFKFETTIASLASPPPYKAISYSWGGPGEIPVIITVNGLSLYIPANLHFALEQVNQTLGNPWLWVDALCINKADQNERNWQATHTYDRFTSAESVFFCVGPAANDSNLLFDFLINWGRKAADIDIYPGDSFFCNDTNSTDSNTQGAQLHQRAHQHGARVQQTHT